MKRLTPGLFGLLLLAMSLFSACGTAATPAPTTTANAAAATDVPSTATQAVVPTLEATPVRASIASPSPTVDILPAEIGFDPAEWMSWPVLPVVTENVREIYHLGQSLGNNPHAFSILGDCQSTPDTFLGLYELDAAAFAQLPLNLQETVLYFGGSLNRESPTAKSGTTSGAILWSEWHDGNYGCGVAETPLTCELRLNQPSFAIITVGTHWEARNDFYMRKIIDQLLAQGVVPILSTKADNREGDHSLNLQTAQLAIEYNLPLWNFWAVTSDLPGNGLVVKQGDEHLGPIYFNEEVKARHRLSALRVLDAVRRVVASP